MARKLPRLQRVLDAPDLASVAYGEVASSLYFALGIVALHALGFTPVVLAIVGVLFLVVTMSYAEGTTSIGETGGAATFVRVAFNDLAGFVTGWALFLDYLIVIALSALFFPHYLGLAIGVAVDREPPGRSDRRLPLDRGDCGRAPVPPDEALLLQRGRAAAGSRHPAAAGAPGLRLSLLAERADARAPPRHAALVAPDRLRVPARAARVHGPRDRGEPRRAGAPARPRPAAEPLHRHRRSRPRHRADRARRTLRLPGAERDDGARHDLAEGAADGRRLRARPAHRATGSSGCCGCTWD